MHEVLRKHEVTHRHFGNAQTLFFDRKTAPVRIEFILQTKTFTNENNDFEICFDHFQSDST